MKHLLLLFTLITSLALFSQNKKPNINDVHLTYEDTRNIEIAKQYKNFFKFKSYDSQDGTNIKVGDTLFFGKPAVDKKQYSQYSGNNSVFSGIIHSTLQSSMLTGMTYVPAEHQGKVVIVQHLLATHIKAGRKSPLYISACVKFLDFNAKMTIIDIDKSLRLGEVTSPNSPMSREEAIAKLKEAKDLYDLELMEEADYLKIKEELTPLIMGK